MTKKNKSTKIKSNLKISDLIWTKKKSLSKDFCNHVIDKFDNDDRKVDGRVSGERIIDKSVKQSIDLCISPLSEWKEEDAVFHSALRSAIPEYSQFCVDLMGHGFYHLYSDANYQDSGYQIQRTKPGEFYIWHHDFSVEELGPRVGTFIWYLNDIKNDGYTEFIDGTRIQPKAGKLIIFPATWTYIHRGYPPKDETKYICTGWIF